MDRRWSRAEKPAPQRPELLTAAEHDRFNPLFEAQAAGHLRRAVSTVTIAEVLTGPLQSRDETLARRYRSVLEPWHVVELTGDIAESAARIPTSHRLRLADAIQVASALAINADTLVTHDRDS